MYMSLCRLSLAELDFIFTCFSKHFHYWSEFSVRVCILHVNYEEKSGNKHKNISKNCGVSKLSVVIKTTNECKYIGSKA